MARGEAARRRRSARRATARKQGAKSAPQDTFESTPLLTRLQERAERRAELAATGSTSLPLSDRATPWDAGAAAKTLDPGDYTKAFFYHDASKPNDQITSYKLGFASKNGGTLTAIFRGITAVAGALQGARGGVKGLSDSDVASIKSDVESYYSKAAKQYKDDSIKPPWKADKAEAQAMLITLGFTGFETFEEHATDTDVAAVVLAYAECGDDLDAYEERYDFWQAELNPTSIHALARMEQELATLAAMGACANCDHAYSEHLGSAGPCTMDGCDCNGYDAPDSASIEYDPAPELTLALSVVKAAADDAAAADFIRFELSDFAIAQAVTFAAADPVAGTLPDDHKPGARVPKKNPSPKAPAAVIPGPMQWSAIFAPEGKLTSDRRAFAPESITWRDLPLSLMGMIETTEGGHVGAQISGRIDQIWRDQASNPIFIRGSGVFDNGEWGSEIARLVADQKLRGVSVDLAIGSYETGPRSDWFDDEGNWAPKEEAAADGEGPSLADLYSDDIIAVVLAAEIGMVTVCPFPAFAEAKIAPDDSLIAGANPAFWTVTQQGGFTVQPCEPCGLVASVEADVTMREVIDTLDNIGLTASAAGLVPDKPPAEWFENPNLEEPTGIIVDDDGRIYGHAAVWNVCHIGLPGQCRTAPHSNSDYAYFHLGEVLCEAGERIPCGQITLDTGHADRELRAADATAHYDHTGLVAAHVVCGEDEYGIWVAGALQPDAPAEKVRLLRGAKLSGDWRKVEGNFELVALLAVNVPGFPVPRARALVAAIDGHDLEPITLVAAGIPVFAEELTAEENEQLAELQREWLNAEIARAVEAA